jgi:hypothetical protein
MDGVRSNNGSCEKYIHKFRGEPPNATELLRILSIQSGLILKLNFWYIGFEDVEWIYLALDGNQCQNLVNKATNVTGLLRQYITKLFTVLWNSILTWRRKQNSQTKLCHPPTRLHVSTTQKTTVLIFTATQAWKLVLIINLHISF